MRGGGFRLASDISVNRKKGASDKSSTRESHRARQYFFHILSERKSRAEADDEVSEEEEEIPNRSMTTKIAATNPSSTFLQPTDKPTNQPTPKRTQENRNQMSQQN